MDPSLRLVLRSPIRVPVVEADHVADEQVEEAVPVPVHEDRVAVAARVAVVRPLGTAPMMSARGVGSCEAAYLRRAIPHALGQGEAKRVGREGLVPQDVPLNAPDHEVGRSRAPPVPDRRYAEEAVADVRVALFDLLRRVVDGTALRVAAPEARTTRATETGRRRRCRIDRVPARPDTPMLISKFVTRLNGSLCIVNSSAMAPHCGVSPVAISGRW